MRHAKACVEDEAGGDHARPLSPRGERAAPAMGRELLRLGLIPDRVITSTAVRAAATAQAVVAALGRSVVVETRPGLYLAPPSLYLATAAAVPATVATLLMVGHNPGLEELASDLAGERIALPTAGLAGFVLNVQCWSSLERDTPSTLRILRHPRQLED